MKKGFIHTGKNSFGHYVNIRIEGYPEHSFYGYRMEEAKRLYKEHYFLGSKRVSWMYFTDFSTI